MEGVFAEDVDVVDLYDVTFHLWRCMDVVYVGGVIGVGGETGWYVACTCC